MTPTEDPLAALSTAPAPMARLRGALAERAEEEGLVDAVFSYVHTPIGSLFVAATPAGVARLGFHQEHAPVSALVRDVGPRVVQLPAGPARGRAGEILAQAGVELREYFDRTRREFTVPLDIRVAGFRGEVVRELSAIDYGRRSSYKDLAVRLGNPGAVRAVGSACARNPIPIFVPCHRVVRSDGSWGQYRGGPEAKTFLLELEGTAAQEGPSAGLR